MTENPQPPRQTGAWPVREPVTLDAHETDQDEQYAQRQQERALHEMVLDSITHDLTQQPSAASVRTAARAWCTRITAAAEDIIGKMR